MTENKKRNSWWSRPLVSRGSALLITAITLYLLAPGLLEVFSSWDQVSQLELRWLLMVGVTQVAAWAFVWDLQRMVLGTTRWLPVVTSQLAGNAAARVVPGGGAAGLALQFRLLRQSGIKMTNAAVGLTAVTIMQFATNLGLPILVLPVLLTGPAVAPRFVSIAVLALVVFATLLVVTIAAFTSDRLLVVTGALVDVVRRRLPFLAAPKSRTADRLLSERQGLRRAFGSRWPRAVADTVGRSTFDFVSLSTAVAAFGVEARPSLVLLAFASASWLSMIPITPGGLGFVEAGLTGLLVLAGVPATESVSIAFLYRLFSFWLPIPVGLAAGAFHGIRYRSAAQ